MTRTCQVPTNKSIFFPVFNVECSTVEGIPPPGDTLQECATIITNAALEDSSLFATLDGEDVLGNISDNRAASGLFKFTLPKNNVDVFCPTETPGVTQQCPPGPTKAAADGIWVLLPPLERGTHKIHFGGSFFGGELTQDNTYTLTVKGKPAT